MRGLVQWAIGLIAACAFAAASAAQERLALVVGVSDYDSGREELEASGFRVPPVLPNTLRDANLVGDALEEAGFSVRRLENPNKRELLAEFGRFAEDLGAAGEDAVGVFYFAGHGAQGHPPFERDVDNFLIPLGAELQTETDLEDEAIGLSRISAQLSAAHAGPKVIILDACRDFPLPQADRSPTLSRGLAEARAAAGTLIAYSTAPGEVALDGPPGGNGPYAAALAAAIRSARGARLEDIFYAVREGVLAATDGDQQTWESHSLRGPIFIGDPVVGDAASQVGASDPDACTLMESQWRAVPDAVSGEIVREFLSTIPEGCFLLKSQISNKLRDIEIADAERAEALQYNSAISVKTRDSYNSFLRDFPTGDRAEEIRRRLASCRFETRKTNLIGSRRIQSFGSIGEMNQETFQQNAEECRVGLARQCRDLRDLDEFQVGELEEFQAQPVRTLAYNMSDGSPRVGATCDAVCRVYAEEDVEVCD